MIFNPFKSIALRLWNSIPVWAHVTDGDQLQIQIGAASVAIDAVDGGYDLEMRGGPPLWASIKLEARPNWLVLSRSRPGPGVRYPDRVALSEGLLPDNWAVFGGSSWARQVGPLVLCVSSGAKEDAAYEAYKARRAASEPAVTTAN